MSLIDAYLKELAVSKSKEDGLNIVKKTVLGLNELNENCRRVLIETDQREDLAEIMIIAGNLKNYNDRDEDITEEWREW